MVEDPYRRLPAARSACSALAACYPSNTGVVRAHIFERWAGCHQGAQQVAVGECRASDCAQEHVRCGGQMEGVAGHHCVVMTRNHQYSNITERQSSYLLSCMLICSMTPDISPSDISPNTPDISNLSPIHSPTNVDPLSHKNRGLVIFWPLERTTVVFCAHSNGGFGLVCAGWVLSQP